ncbi:hypothetical protein MNBD_GAMMA23-2052 [hydrothermal vent metagenome]|uniref:HDOD domain-containing protein n=1 Tax=hydrothermal vent metagenome TaxID=652676 RepID=A0A3B0ZW15_9ZZZZ
MLQQTRTADVLQDILAKIGNHHFPVMERTIIALKKACTKDDAKTEEITHIVSRDPGLTLYLLRVCNTKLNSSLRSEITSISQALMMLGIKQVSQLPAKLPNLDKTLKDQAKHRLLTTFSRAYHAAEQATEWAHYRRDMNTDEIFVATQIHFIGEMALAMIYPDKLAEIDRLRRRRQIASEEAQYLVLGFAINQLSYELARKWELPSLALEALKPENAKYPRAYSVMLAVQLARSAAVDWHGGKTQVIQNQIADFLDIPIAKIATANHKLAVDVARQTHFYGVFPAAALLPMLDDPLEEETIQAKNPNEHADICLMPQRDVLKNIITNIENSEIKRTMKELIHLVLQGMHDGIGLNRVVFATRNADKQTMVPYSIKGADNDPGFNRFTIKLHKENLFGRLMQKTQAIVINNKTRSTFWELIPKDFKKLVVTNSFLAMSIFVKGEEIGFFYADRHTIDCQIDDTSYRLFKSLCTSAIAAMEQLDSLHLRE